MSGIEVAGIVLAVFPLVLTALDKLSNSTSGRLWGGESHGSEVRALRLEIQTQHVLFQNSYLKLLLSFLDEVTIVRLLADPEGLARNESLSENIKVHLGEQWPIYESLMARMRSDIRALHENIEKVANSIQRDAADLLESSKALLKKLQFDFSVKRRAGLLKRLKEDNQTFSLLVDQQRTLKSLGHQFRNPLTEDSRAIHTRTSGLFLSLVKTLRCPPSCQKVHSADIPLAPLFAPDRSRPPTQQSSAPPVLLEFRGHTQGNAELKSRWRAEALVTQERDLGSPLCLILQSLKQQPEDLPDRRNLGSAGKSPTLKLSSRRQEDSSHNRNNLSGSDLLQPSRVQSLEQRTSIRRSIENLSISPTITSVQDRPRPSHLPSSSLSLQPPFRRPNLLSNPQTLPYTTVSYPTRVLYLAGLPRDTSEQELTTLLSSLNGYSDMFFRPYITPPFCFAYFKDEKFAIEALGNLYNHKFRAHDQIVIRASFSEDPLDYALGLQREEFMDHNRDEGMTVTARISERPIGDASTSSQSNLFGRSQYVENPGPSPHPTLRIRDNALSLTRISEGPAAPTFTNPVPELARRHSSSSSADLTVQLVPIDSAKANRLSLVSVVDAARNISLSSLLASRDTFTCFPSYFFERDRARLAATLASALLGLHDSPWLHSQWSSKDIFFDLSSEKGVSPLDLDLDRESLLKPFATALLPKSRKASSLEAISLRTTPKTSTFGIKNQALYSLGMVLLELIMNAPLSSFRQDVHETDAQVAWRLEREVCGRAGPRWADIVATCLHCPFPGSANLEEEGFLRAVHAAVVSPLVEMTMLKRLSK